MILYIISFLYSSPFITRYAYRIIHLKSVQQMGPFSHRSLQRPRIQPQRLQNQRGILHRRNLVRKHSLLDIRRAHNASNNSVIIAYTSMLRDPRAGRSVDDACFWSDDDIRNRWVCLWVSVPEVSESITGEDI